MAGVGEGGQGSEREGSVGEGHNEAMPSFDLLELSRAHTPASVLANAQARVPAPAPVPVPAPAPAHALAPAARGGQKGVQGPGEHAKEGRRLGAGAGTGSETATAEGALTAGATAAVAGAGTAAAGGAAEGARLTPPVSSISAFKAKLLASTGQSLAGLLCAGGLLT